jgi:two-component system, OmpR family, response regulator TctD
MGEPMCILIVEDTSDVGEAIVASLSRAGYAVDRQTTGEGARDALNVQSYDLIILDVMLPDVDGFTL